MCRNTILPQYHPETSFPQARCGCPSGSVPATWEMS